VLSARRPIGRRADSTPALSPSESIAGREYRRTKHGPGAFRRNAGDALGHRTPLAAFGCGGEAPLASPPTGARRPGGDPLRSRGHRGRLLDPRATVRCVRGEPRTRRDLRRRFARYVHRIRRRRRADRHPRAVGSILRTTVVAFAHRLREQRVGFGTPSFVFDACVPIPDPFPDAPGAEARAPTGSAAFFSRNPRL